MNLDMRWKGVSHQQIWDWAHAGPGAKASAEAEQVLEDINKRLVASVKAVAKTLEAAGAVWQGPAAARATAGMQALRQYTDGLALTSDSSRNSTMGQAGTSDWARKAVPPVEKAGPAPTRPTGFSIGDVLKQTVDWQVREASARNAERRAQEVMEQHTSYTRQRVASMPVLQPVPKIVLNTEVPPPPAPPPGPPVPPRVRDRRPGGGSTSGGQGGSVGGGAGDGSGRDGGGDGQRRPEAKPGDFVEGKPIPAPIPSPQPGPVTPPERSELVWSPDPERGSGGTGFSGGGAGSFGGGGGLVSPTPNDAHGGGNAGRGGVGAPGAVPPGAVGGVAARAAGTPGQQGFLQPANGAQRAEDSEHQRKYWVPGSDLFDDDRLVAPPVIGED
ncbi:hypothetical protein [Allokutzneria oryzae]|uniref:PPE domain-containing protein n=1 Tax=Allokutzneria oryzae TaxID=1378989 RepID=A0ABV5ZY59_9PSEU